METASASKCIKIGDQASTDVTVQLRNRNGKPEFFHCHSSVLKEKSKFFAYRLSNPAHVTLGHGHRGCIEVHCSGTEYAHLVRLLNLLYVSEDSVVDSFGSVRNALGILQASIALSCEEITKTCIQYLEAVPWDDKEEEEILRVAPILGPAARPILARVQPVDLNAVKDVLVSAIRFATTINRPIPPFSDELKTSAQEQIEYMLLEDEDTPLIAADEDFKSEVSLGLSKLFATFEEELSSLSLIFDQSPEEAEQKLLQSISDLEWMCNILPKLDLMKSFVLNWAHISGNVLSTVMDKKFCSDLWSVKAKLIEVAGKTLDAVAYGNVILPAPSRVELLKIWLDYIRKMKPLLDTTSTDDGTFPFKMDSDLCQNIECAIVSLVLALPSIDQATILTDWMNTWQQKYPDLSEAFEVWCYRTKSAKRRLAMDLEGIGNSTVMEHSPEPICLELFKLSKIRDVGNSMHWLRSPKSNHPELFVPSKGQDFMRQVEGGDPLTVLSPDVAYLPCTGAEPRCCVHSIGWDVTPSSTLESRIKWMEMLL